MSSSPFGPDKYRLIALDLDGTTLNRAGRVSPRTRDSIRALIDRGVHVCFATGRNFTESRSVLEQVGHHDHAVFVGGAHVVDTAAHTSLSVKPIEPSLAREVCRDLEEMGHAVLALQDHFATGFDYFITEGAQIDAETAKWIEITQGKVRLHSDLRDINHTQTLRLSIVSQPEESQEVSRKISEKYGPRVMMHSIEVKSQNLELVEVFDAGVNKWEGIKFIANARQIPGHQIIAVGDDINDLAMLSQAGLGVAMANAHPKAKQSAKHHIGHHAEDGLAIFLEQLLAEDRVA